MDGSLSALRAGWTLLLLGMLAGCSRAQQGAGEARGSNPASWKPVIERTGNSGNAERARPATALPTSFQETNLPGLAYRGCISGDEGLKALIHSTEQGIGSFKEVGQDAFGYTVREIEPAWVVLEKDGKTWRLPRNENGPTDK